MCTFKFESSIFVPIAFSPPVIRGDTTLNEGDTLDLVCDPTTSSPLPSAEWFSPQGDLISNSMDLEIMTIQRSAMGAYTCIITQFGATLNITVNVTVLCEYIHVPKSVKEDIDSIFSII